jgi:predicted restriction endonuclease
LHCLNSPGIDLREAYFNEDTKFPPDFNPFTEGARFVGLATCFFETALLMDISDHPFLSMTEYDSQSTLNSEVNKKTETLDIVSNSLEKGDEFNPEIIEDSREKIQRAIVQRRGQPQFRQELLKAYNNKCAITGFDAEQSLEAAHIYPYKGDDTNKVENGLLLRADIHTLFDLYLIAVQPEAKEILIAPELMKTKYKKLNKRKLNVPKDLRQHPSLEALEWYYKQCSWINQINEP